MTGRSWRLPVAVLACVLLAATVSLHHMEYLPALLIIAPGYLVQAWLFVRHHALGGLGYRQPTARTLLRRVAVRG
jgi:hypothetical protein